MEESGLVGREDVWYFVAFHQSIEHSLLPADAQYVALLIPAESPKPLTVFGLVEVQIYASNCIDLIAVTYHTYWLEWCLWAMIYVKTHWLLSSALKYVNYMSMEWQQLGMLIPPSLMDASFRSFAKNMGMRQRCGNLMMFRWKKHPKMSMNGTHPQKNLKPQRPHHQAPQQ